MEGERLSWARHTEITEGGPPEGSPPGGSGGGDESLSPSSLAQGVESGGSEGR